jgi:hypothetical protein
VIGGGLIKMKTTYKLNAYRVLAIVTGAGMATISALVLATALLANVPVIAGYSLITLICGVVTACFVGEVN